jgi:hypothetical protein
MNLLTVAAAVFYVLAGLCAKGWLLSASLSNCLLFIAAGLLFTLLAGFDPVGRHFRAPTQ